jgi:hypothetical protein
MPSDIFNAKMAALYFRIASLAINQAKIKIASEEDPGHLEDTKRGIAYYPQLSSSGRVVVTVRSNSVFLPNPTTHVR